MKPIKTKLLVLALCSVMIPALTQASGTAPSPQPTADKQQNSPSKRAIGFEGNDLLNQSFVGLSSGAAQFSLPLNLPAGINGFQPDLNLSYNSQQVNSNGVFGFGFEISLPNIHRSNKNGIDKMYSEPIFVLDINGSGGELIKVSDNGQTEQYRLRKEGSFFKISYNQPSNTWELTTQDGYTYYFASQQTDVDGKKAYAWYVTTITEPHGQTVNFSYDLISGVLYPAQILYGPDELFRIDFYRQNQKRHDLRTSRQAGFSQANEYLIDRIEIWSQNQKRLQYNMQYITDNIRSRSMLKQIVTEATGTEGEQTSQSIQFGYYLPGKTPVGYRNNLLQSIVLPQGANIEFDYRPSTKFFNENGLANKLPYPMVVVDSVTKSDFLNFNDVTTYEYADGHFYYESPHERQMAGFGKTTVTDALGQKTITFFHQGGGQNRTDLGENPSDHRSLIGTPYRTEKYNANNQPIQTTINKWQYEEMNNNIYFPYLAQSITTTIQGGVSYSTANENEYDITNGKITKQIHFGLVNTNNDGSFTDIENDKRTTLLKYTTGEKTLPASQELLNNNDQVVSRKTIYYDGLDFGLASKGDASKTCQWLNTENRDICTSNDHDEMGRVTKQIDPRGNPTTFAYDHNAIFPDIITNASGHTTTMQYDLMTGNTIKITDANGLIVKQQFDGLGRLISTQKGKQENPATISSREYHDERYPNLVIDRIHMDGQQTVDSYTYLDGFGRVIQTKQMANDGKFTVIGREYDALGRLHKETLPIFVANNSYNRSDNSSIATETEYNAFNEPTKITDANGVITIDRIGLTQNITDANGNTKILRNDAFGNLIQVTENGATTEYQYNALNKQIKLIDAENNVRNFYYDSLGRTTVSEMLHRPQESGYGTWQYKYDDNNNPVKITDPKQQVFEYEYDVLNRLTTEKADEQISYRYDQGENAIGQITAISKPQYNWQAEYDISGRVANETVEIDATTYTKSYTYNQIDLPLSVNHDGHQLDYQYNEAGQLRAITNLIDTIEYGPNGQMTELHYSNGTVSTNDYDEQSMYRLIGKMTVDGNDNIIQNLVYDYDAVGNIVNLTENADTAARQSANYNYDELYRLTSTTVTNSMADYVREQTYDRIGNILSKSDQGNYTYNAPHPQAVTSLSSGTQFAYDQNGNMISEVTGDTIKSFTWDYNNRLKQLDIANTADDQAFKFWYDQSGRRIKKQLTETKADEEGVVSTTETFALYPFNDVEIDETSNIKINVFAGSAHVAVVEINPSNNNQTISFHHNDHLGSANIITDENGQIVQTLTYYPFGAIHMASETESHESTRKFTGHELDESSLYYAQARYYNPAIGRFVSVDPLVVANPGKLDGYSYVTNNPLKYVDPSGLYNIKTGEIENGDNQEKIINAIVEDFGIYTNWETIKEVSFYNDRFGNQSLENLVGKNLWIGSDITADVTYKLNNLNRSRALMAKPFRDSSLLFFTSHLPWDIKNSSDPILGTGKNGREYWSYIYRGRLIRYDAPGNINYGYVAKSLGLPNSITQNGAITEQVASDIATLRHPSLSDNSGDSKYVQMGINSYNSDKSFLMRIFNWIL